jgi:hypothetical protein
LLRLKSFYINYYIRFCKSYFMEKRILYSTIKIFLCACLYINFQCAPELSFGQTVYDSVTTGGLKYTLLEVTANKNDMYTPDADQDVIEKVQPMYPRAIMTFWHSTFSTPADPMIITGDPFAGTGYVSAFPRGTIDRAMFSGSVEQNRPWETKVGTRDALSPNFDVKVACTYDQVSRLLTVRVTGTSLVTLTGNWRINAFVVEDSISSGLSSLYNQKNFYNPTGTASHATGSPSYFIGAGNPITSGSLYSHMHVARAILCPGGDIWGEAAFSNPTSGTSVTKTYTYTIPVSYVAKNMKVIGLVEKYGATTTDRAVENAIEVRVPAAPVLFTGGHSQSMSICQDAGASSINSLAAVSDTYVGHTVNWSLVSGPFHGTASATYSTTSTGGVLTPSGLTYTPATAYSGMDTFKIRVADGTDVDTTTIYVTVTPAPSAISGSLSICPGGTSTLSSSPSGGTWTSSATSIVSIGSTSGMANGIATGTSSITYTITGGCSTTAIATVSAAPSAGTITGTTSICIASSATLSSSVSGGTWSSGATGIATVGSATGTVTGVAVGTAVISYTATTSCGTATSTYTVSIISAPSAGTISGSSTLCTGATTTLTSSSGGGTWSSSATGTATVGSATGVVSGIAAGTVTISYSVTSSCGTVTATFIVTVTVAPSAGTITGASSVCEGATTTLSSTMPGGMWSSGTTGVATIDATTGVVTGVSPGTTAISYSIGGMCGTATATYIISVNPMPDAGTITGPASVCEGQTITLSNTIAGGTWSGSNANATVSSTGMVTGVTAGAIDISYTVTNSCGSASATSAITVIAAASCPVVAPLTEHSNSLTIYPNPASNELHVSVSQTGITGYNEIDITNIVGKTMLRIALKNGDNTFTIASFPSGIYLIEVTSAKGEKVVKKIVKE